MLRAAGGVVWRSDLSLDAAPRIVIVHRPGYGDWSLPKGKLNRGEHALTAAVREVREETGVLAVPQAGLPSVHYQVHRPGTPANPLRPATPAEQVDKVVDYWSMRVATCARRLPDHEVDDVRWVPEDEAYRMLTYSRDRAVVNAFLARPPVTGVVCLVRSARKLARVLALLRPTRILTPTAERYRLSTAPLSALTMVRVETNSNFDQDADPATTAAAVLALGRSTEPTIICCRSRLIPPTLAAMTGRDAVEFPVRKGSGWLLAFTTGQLSSVTELSPDPPPDPKVAP